MAPRRFEYSHGTSNKFWEVWVQHIVVHTRFGKIGSIGQTSKRRTAGPLEADELIDRLVGEKVRKGYREIRAQRRKAANVAKSANGAKAAVVKLTPAQKKRALIERVRKGNPGGESLRGADLACWTFTKVDLAGQDLTRANLYGTKWKSCSFDHATLDHAFMAGAVFEDCTFALASVENVRGRGVRFKRCKFDTEMRNADLRGAKFIDTAVDSELDLSWSNAKDCVLELTYSDPRRGNWLTLHDTNLRAAKIKLSLTPAAQKKTGVEWYDAHAEHAKVDKRTRFEYQPIAGVQRPTTAAVPRSRPQRVAASRGFDAAGTAAEIIGALYAQSASLWFLAVDAAAARAWNGDVGFVDDDDLTLDENLAKDPSDFARAMRAADKARPVVRVGAMDGLVATVGGCGWSHIFKLPDGFALVDYAPSDGIDARSKDTATKLAAAVAQLRAKRKPKELGAVRVTSGALALLLPAERGGFTATQLAKARGGSKVVSAGASRALVPAANGTFRCLVEQLAYKDAAFGSIERRVRFVRGSA